MNQSALQTFYKMHSLGNDFMVIDGVTKPFAADPQAIARWGQRHEGVGFDQLLIIEPPTEPNADFWFRIFNTDGSSAEQCGNGTRCVAMLAHQLKLTKKSTLDWQSEAGMIRTVRESNGTYTTTMTVPVLNPESIPFNPPAGAGETGPSFDVSDADRTYNITPVSMGNPHGVLFMPEIFDVDVTDIGARLSSHAAFPRRANIGFCQVIDRQFIRLRVFERGAGETRACGSGACAAVVAARLHDLVDEQVKVSLPGGKLRISWLAPDQPVTMNGPATLVFTGEIRLSKWKNKS